jgi:enoyl-CoA hydratase
VRATKQILAEAASWTELEAFEAQRAIAAPVFASDDAKEGARAFAEKRAPQWTGA